MRRNAVLERVKPGFTEDITENNEVLMLLEKVIEIMNNGFEAMDIRFHLIEEKLGKVNSLLEQMGTDKRI